MKEMFRLSFVFVICALTLFLLRKSGSGFETVFFAIIAVETVLYLADFLMRRFFRDHVLSLALGIVFAGVLSWAVSQWIFSLTFLSGFLERLPWKPFLEILMVFLSVIWIASKNINFYPFFLPPFRQDFRERSFKRLYFFLAAAAVLSFTVLMFSQSQIQALWQGHAASEWVSNMAQGNYDFQLKLHKTMNAAPLILGAGLTVFLMMIWVFRRYCLPYIGFVILLSSLAGFLNHLLLEIYGDILSKWMPGDLMQFFILLNAFYFALSWGMHVTGQRDFRRSN